MIKELGDIQSVAKWYELFYWQKSRDVSVFGADEKNIEDNNGVLKPVLSAAMCIILLSKAVLLIKNNGCVDTEWKRSISLWFEEYKKCWLKNNKYSELDEIKFFVDKI